MEVQWNECGGNIVLGENTHVITCADILCCVIAVSDRRWFRQPHYCADFSVFLTHCLPIIITAKHVSYKVEHQLVRALKDYEGVWILPKPNFTFSRVWLSYFNCEKSWHVKDHVESLASLKATELGKSHAGALYEIDKLLLLLLEDWIQKYVPLILMMIPVKWKDFFRGC